jgi:hypothetical protein
MTVQFSWSSLSVRLTAEKNGGVPARMLAVINDKRQIVVWEPTGEVKTIEVQRPE